jgi:hypothetical protein
MRANRIVIMPPQGMGTARGNCGFLDVSTILSKDSCRKCGGDCGDEEDFGEETVELQSAMR